MKDNNNTIVSLCHHIASSFRFVFKRDCLEHRFVQLDLSKAGKRHLWRKGPHSWTLLRVGLKYLDPCHLLRVWNIYETPRDFSCPAFNSLRGYPFSVLFLCDVPSPLFHNHMLSWMRTNRMSVREHLWSKDTWRMQRDYYCKVKRCDSERRNLQHVDIGNIAVFYLVMPLYGCVDGPRSAMLPREQRHDAMSQTCQTNPFAEVRDGDDLGLLERSLQGGCIYALWCCFVFEVKLSHFGSLWFVKVTFLGDPAGFHGAGWPRLHVGIWSLHQIKTTICCPLQSRMCSFCNAWWKCLM